MQVKSKSGRVFDLPTAREEAEIAAGISADRDTLEADAAWFAQAQHFPKRGRPALPHRRPTLNMRVDEDVLAAFKATGKGWQTRLHAVLREAVDSGKVK